MIYLKFLRIKHDHTLGSFARATGVHRFAISQIEKGRVNPTDDEVQRLATALGVSHPDQLLVGVDASPLGDGAEARDHECEDAEAK